MFLKEILREIIELLKLKIWTLNHMGHFQSGSGLTRLFTVFHVCNLRDSDPYLMFKT